MQLGMDSACGRMCSYRSTSTHIYLHSGIGSACGRMLDICADALNAAFCVCVLMIGYFCLMGAEDVSHPSGSNAVIMVKNRISLLRIACEAPVAIFVRDF